jgi:hypothetical protein
MSSHELAPGSLPAVTVPLNGKLTAQVMSGGAGRTLVVFGIRSARTLRRLSRAIASWHAFGRYDRVVLDLRDFSDASSDLRTLLAEDVRKAAAAGRCLDFVPPSALDGSAPRDVGSDLLPASSRSRTASVG